MRYKILALLVIGCLIAGKGAATAWAADFSLSPNLSVMEEYTDNVFGDSTHKKSDFITSVLPGLNLNLNMPDLNFMATYTFDYIHYDGNTRGDEFDHFLNAQGNAKIIDNFLLMDLSDVYQKVSLNPNRNAAAQSIYLGQTEANVLHVSPYIQFFPTDRLKIKTGYVFTDMTYTEVDAINKLENGGYFRATDELTPKTSMFANVLFVHTDTSIDLSYDRLVPSMGFQYEYAPRAFVSVEGGCSTLFLAKNSYTGPYWNVRLSYPFHTLTASITSGVTYNEDPLLASSEQRGFTVRLEKQLHRGTADVYALYSDYINSLKDSSFSKVYEVGCNGKYGFTPRTAGHFDLAVDKYSETATSYKMLGDYSILFDAGVSYALPHKMSVGLIYYYVSDRNAFWNPSSKTDTNRVMLMVSKQFKGVGFTQW